MSYSAQQQRADVKIRRKGKQVTLVWERDRSIDIVTDTPGLPRPVSAPVYMIAFPFKKRNAAGDSFEPRSDVIGHERRFLMSANDVPVIPQSGMRIKSWEGHPWTIIGCDPLAPDDDVVIVYSGVMTR